MNIEELHEKFQEYGKNAKLWQRKCLMLLPEIQKQEVWRKKGFSSIYEYAAKLAGLSRGQVEDALYILRKIQDKPALQEVASQKGLNSIRPIITIANADEKFWAKKAMEMSNNTLRTYIRDIRNSHKFTGTSEEEFDIGIFRDIPKNESTTKTILMQLPENLANELEKLKGSGGWAELTQKFIELYKKDLQFQHENLKAEKPQVKKAQIKKSPPGKKPSRNIPAKIKRYVLKRSNGKCEFPNCHKSHEHLHHTNRFGSDKTHSPDQIVALCKAHHDLAHKGLIDHEEQLPKRWQIRKEIDYTSLNRFIDDQMQFYRRR